VIGKQKIGDRGAVAETIIGQLAGVADRARGPTDPASADDADDLQGGVCTARRGFSRRDEFLKAGFNDTPRVVFSRRASSS